MRSDVVKKGVTKAPHRSLFKASGLTDEEINLMNALNQNQWTGPDPDHFDF